MKSSFFQMALLLINCIGMSQVKVFKVKVIDKVVIVAENIIPIGTHGVENQGPLCFGNWNLIDDVEFNVRQEMMVGRVTTANSKDNGLVVQVDQSNRENSTLVNRANLPSTLKCFQI